MFGSLGFTEIAFVLVLALLLFGPKRLPEIGKTIGKGMAEFRRASNDLKRTLEREVAFDELEQRGAGGGGSLTALKAPTTLDPNAATRAGAAAPPTGPEGSAVEGAALAAQPGASDPASDPERPG